ASPQRGVREIDFPVAKPGMRNHVARMKSTGAVVDVPPDSLPDARGHFGPFGGVYVPETLMTALQELDRAYAEAREDPAFQEELRGHLREFCGRPTPLYHAARLTEHCGGAK